MTKEEAIQAWEQMRSEIDKENWLFVGTINPLMIDMAIEALEADTVEVVRCKDCKWATEARMKSIEGDVIVLKTCPSRTEVIEDDDYCSYGERSDNANTD